MIKKSIICLLVLSQCIGKSMAQMPAPMTQPELNKSIIPPSPDAASLGKYGTFPVTEYMGKANVDITLFDIKLPKVSVPIRLGYNYTGFRPAEVASNIGLGWDLQAGGVITRSIKGRVDEDVDKKWADIPNVFLYENNQEILTQIAENQSSVTTRWDTEPDLYQFNFNGYSGSFIMIKNKPVIFPHQNLQIEKVLDDIIITTADGTKYEFKDKETTTINYHTNNNGQQILTYTSAWNLTNIRSYDLSELVQFKYTNWTHPLGGKEFSETYFKRVGKYAGMANPSGFIPDADDRTVTSVSNGNILAKRLDEIISRTARVVLIPETTARLDIINYASAKAFKEINIYSKPDNALIKKIKFNHGYFIDPLNTTYPQSQLKLSSVEIWGQNKTTNSTTVESSNPQIYSFEYHAENENDFPRITKGIDYWGYYNGVNNNNSLFNSDMLAVVYTPKGGQSNRDVNVNKVKNGIITKITYPTKGYSTFEYEINRVEPPGSPQVGYIALGSFTSCQYNSNSGSEPTVCTSSGNIQIDAINGNGGQTFTVEVNRELPSSPDPSTIKNFRNLLEIYQVGNATTPVYTFPKMGIGQVHRIESVTLPAGLYFYKVKCESSATLTSAEIRYKIIDPNLPAIDGPGLRIKTINSYNNINGTTPPTPSLVKRYEYAAPAKTNMNSWGCQLLNTVQHLDCMSCKYGALEYIYSSGAGSVVQPHNTEQFYYPIVIEINHSTVANGKKVSKYANPGYTVAGVQLTEQAIYKGNNELVSKTINTNQIGTVGGSYWGGAANVKWQWHDLDPSCYSGNYPPLCSPCSGNDHAITDQNFNRQRTYRFEPKLYTTYYNILTQSKEYTYDENGVEQIVQKDYFYENPLHTMPTKIVEKNGNGEEITTLSKYPFDYALSNCETAESNYATFNTQREALLQTTYANISQRENYVINQVTSSGGYNECSALPNNLLAYLNSPSNQFEELAIANYTPILANHSNFYSNLKSCSFFAISSNPSLTTLQRATLAMQGYNIINPPIEQQSFIKKGTTEYLQNAIKYGFEYAGIAGGVNVNPTTLYNTTVNPVTILKANFLTNPSSFYQSKVNFKYNAWGNIIRQNLQDDIKTSYVYDYSDLYPTAQVTNAESHEIAYTSFEADMSNSGGWAINGGTSSTTAFIGNKGYTFSGGAELWVYDVPASKTYTVSFWQYGLGAVTVKSNSTVINPITSLTMTRNGWTYYEYLLPNTTVSVTVSSANATIDELRLYPSNALMTNYCYDPQMGQTATISTKNDVQFYEYDASGRLVVVRDQNKNVLKRICYNFAGQQEDCPIAPNCGTTAPNWQNTANTRCVVNSYGVNTGAVEQEQEDVNACTPTFRWVAAGTNTTICPIPTYVNLTSTNTYGTTGYVAVYTPIPFLGTPGNGTAYVFNVTAATGLQALGSIPEGHYTLQIYRTFSPPYALFKSGCWKQMMTGTEATFSNITVTTSGCNSITITLEN
jgi:YD repeat-containing protein